MNKKDTKTIKERDRVSSLERGLRVLRVFDQDSMEMTPAEVARLTELPRAATRRILLTLCELGYAASDGKHFRLTPKVLDLAHGYLAKTRIRDLIEPVMRTAVEEVKDSCTLAVRDGTDSISVASCNSSNFGAVNVTVGLRIPLYVSTPGRMILASLPRHELESYLSRVKLARHTPNTITSKSALHEEIARIQAQGYALGREEWEPGVYALAVPVHLKNGSSVAGLTFIGNVARINTDKAVTQRIAVLRQAAERIYALLPDSPDFTREFHLAGS